jgi:predicted ATPase/transcriptional regulator with XRE-family HTH domain
LADVSFGEWLNRRRGAQGWTQEQLAQQIHCSTSALRKFESEERRPSAQIVERLADIFNIAQDERETFLRFARGDWKSAPSGAHAKFPWSSSTRSPSSNLPAPVNSLIGREKEIALVREYLSTPTIRLVTLMGPPGIGKTRLSMEAGRTVLPDFPNGVFFVPLAPLAEATFIEQTVAQSLGYVTTKNNPIREQLKEGIGDKKLLLVLDNCEHLIEDVSSLASDLLSACSHLKLLTTSRESLRIPGEWVFPVPALDLPEKNSSAPIKTVSAFPALTLFAERARAVHPHFALDADNIQAVASICIQVDGLPLAIEIMAARMRLMAPQALLDQLNDQYVLSADGMRSASPRQKTLNDAIAWSHKLLSETEQRLFTYLAVFSGGFTQEAVEAMFSDSFVGISISSLLTSLLDKSLLQRASDPETPDAALFSMLVTIQHFALSRLRDMEKEEEARRQHAAYFLAFAKQAAKEIHGHGQVKWLHRLTAMRDNLRSALEWAVETAQTEIALQMANDLSWFWNMRSEFSEGRLWLGKVVAMPDARRYPNLYSYTLAQLALLTWLQSGPKKARPFVEQALATAREHNDKGNVAWALSILGLFLPLESDFTGAQSALEESRALFREVDDMWGYAYAVGGLGLNAYTQGDLATSLALQEEEVIRFRQLGDKFFENEVLRNIAVIQIRQGNLTGGMAALREALLISQQLDSKQEIAWALIQIGDAARAEGDAARAASIYLASRNILDSLGALKQDDETVLEEKLAACRAALSESAFNKAVEQSRSMTMEQAITYALESSINS